MLQLLGKDPTFIFAKFCLLPSWFVFRNGIRAVSIGTRIRNNRFWKYASRRVVHGVSVNSRGSVVIRTGVQNAESPSTQPHIHVTTSPSSAHSSAHYWGRKRNSNRVLKRPPKSAIRRDGTTLTLWGNCVRHGADHSGVVSPEPPHSFRKIVGQAVAGACETPQLPRSVKPDCAG